MKILVVDDEGIVLSSCRKVLAAEGHDVLLAPSVAEAMAILSRQGSGEKPLLLVDVKMPVHDGMVLLREIKALWPGLKVVMMSGYATEETIRKAESLGAVRFIAKPFTPGELMDAVKAVGGKEKNHE